MEDYFDDIDQDDEELPESVTTASDRKAELFKIIQNLQKRGALTTMEEMQLNAALAEYNELI